MTLPLPSPEIILGYVRKEGSGVGVAQVSAQNPGARTWATQPKHARHALFLFGFEDHAIADRNWCMRGDGYAAWKVEPALPCRLDRVPTVARSEERRVGKEWRSRVGVVD